MLFLLSLLLQLGAACRLPSPEVRLFLRFTSINRHLRQHPEVHAAHHMCTLPYAHCALRHMRVVCLRRRSGDLGAALLRAPFVDMVSTALDPQAPLVAHEASEWGDAAGDAAAFDAVSPALLPGMHAADQGKALPPASSQLYC